jgi:hypothetical protein
MNDMEPLYFTQRHLIFQMLNCVTLYDWAQATSAIHDWIENVWVRLKREPLSAINNVLFYCNWRRQWMRMCRVFGIYDKIARLPPTDISETLDTNQRRRRNRCSRDFVQHVRMKHARIAKVTTTTATWNSTFACQWICADSLCHAVYCMIRVCPLCLHRWRPYFATTKKLLSIHCSIVDVLRVTRSRKWQACVPTACAWLSDVIGVHIKFVISVINQGELITEEMFAKYRRLR